MYPTLFRLVLSRLDPEDAHHLAFVVIRALGAPVLRSIARAVTKPPTGQQVEALGLRFDSPFGVAAGFDKEARGVLGLGALGFGHVEIGTVTAIAQPGNPRPRLFRLIPDRAVINRMGFNNAGAEAIRPRLEKLRRVPGRPVIGVNIGKSRVVDVDAATDDYLTSTRLLSPLADYLVVNVSSPNTPGLRGLQEVEVLEPLLAAVRDAAGATPVLVKIAPDVDDEQARGIAALVLRLGLPGIIATNTTLSRENLRTSSSVVEAAGAGGLSGAPLRARSLELLKLLRAELPREICIISVGGVETATEVQERLDAGADLVQGYTGFLYRGPLWARQISRGLARLRSRAS